MANKITIKKIIAKALTKIGFVFAWLGFAAIGSTLCVIAIASLIEWTGLGLARESIYVMATGVMLAVLLLTLATFHLSTLSSLVIDVGEIRDIIEDWDSEDSEDEEEVAAEFKKAFGDRFDWDELPNDAKDFITIHWRNGSLEPLPPVTPTHSNNSNRKKQNYSKAKRT